MHGKPGKRGKKAVSQRQARVSGKVHEERVQDV